MKILSLFDGISCGRVALERAGIPVTRYVAFEIDQDAINVSAWNWPGIEHWGSVEDADFSEFRGFDMVIGGFPCTDLSIGKNNRQGLKGQHSRLFWEQVRAIKEINPRYFLVENNYRMPKADEAIITETLGVRSIHINSAKVSAQNRDRLYWTNIPHLTQPDDKGLVLADILEDRVALKFYVTTLNNYRIIDNIRYGDKSKALCTSMYKGSGSNSMSIIAEKIEGILQHPRGFNKGNLFTEKSPTVTASSWQHNNHVLLNPCRVGDLGKGSQATRVYDPFGKSVCLTSGGGGQGAKTGLYALPYGLAFRTRNTEQGRFKKPEVRLDGKANALTTVTTDSMVVEYERPAVPLFLVEAGILFYKDKKIPVKLSDGYYAIRKLTPVECERLQTLPDGYTEMVSNTQRYRQLGNGWTVDVIAHIFNHIHLDNLL